MRLRESRGAQNLALLLGLILNLRAEKPVSSANISLALEAAISEPIVVESDGNLTQPKEVEFGECSVTCGIGVREVILTKGCPEGETKCIIRIEECRGPADCGWGRPISESLATVKMPCIFVPPENRFQYVWKLLVPDEQSLILPNDSAILEVHRDTHPVAFECDTLENEDLIASVKYTVYTRDELDTRELSTPGSNVTMFVLISGIIVCIGVFFAIIFIILKWTAVKAFWQTKLCRSREEPSLITMRTSSGQISTSDNLQVSQTEFTAHEQVSYQEWNEPSQGGGGGGGGSSEKGNF
nr:sperm acrosome membrane-associated protein 1 [Pogona vitticeps]